jgi:transcriptional regulator with XRE-family HTH domain
MHSDTLKKFAAELKSTREEKQIALTQIAAKTRIDIKYLAAIENANFDILPELYIRAFIKEFAMAVDLNPEETIKKFDMARSGKNDVPEEVEKESIPVPEKIKRPARTIKKSFESEETEPYVHPDEVKKSLDPRILYAVIGVAILILITGLYFIFFSSTTIEKEGTVQQQNTSAETKRYDEVQPVQQASGTNDSLQLKIVANDLVWFEISSDDAAPKQFLFKDQQTATLKAKTKFVMNIGNAGGVKLTLNGKLLDAAGRPGEVKFVQIDKEGIKPLILERPKNERAPAERN